MERSEAQSKDLNEKISKLQSQLNSVKEQHQQHVQAQTVKNLQLETQANGITQAQGAIDEKKVD